jgi:hypothetical protein
VSLGARMDDRHFDRISRIVGSSIDRRTGLRGLGVLLASLLTGRLTVGPMHPDVARAASAHRKRRLRAETCIPTGKPCPAKKPRGHDKHGKARKLSCNRCCQKHTTVVDGQTQCACQPDGLPCQLITECCSGICTNGVCGRTNPSPPSPPPPSPPPTPPPPPPPPPPNFLEICGIGYETCTNSTDGCCVAGQDCCLTPGTGINGCCGVDYTCLEPDLTFPDGRCNPPCDDPNFPLACTNQNGCCPTTHTFCCPNDGGCCSPEAPVCCPELNWCCSPGFVCGDEVTRCRPDPSQMQAQTQERSQGVAMASMRRHRRHRPGKHDKARHRNEPRRSDGGRN